MTLLFMESFDGGDASTANGKWTAVLASPTINTTNPRFTGANAWQIANPNLASDTYRKTLTAGAHATFIAGIAWRPEGTLSGDAVSGKGLLVFRGDSNATTHLTLAVTSSGALRVRRGDATGTILGTTADLISLNTWYYIELKALISDTVGTVNVQVNGVSALSLTGLDTKNAGTNTTFDAVEFGGGGVGCTSRMRDIYICNGAGSVNNNFLGDCRVTHSVVNADSTPEQWTRSTGSDSFALLDEATPNSDTDYIEDAVDGEITRMGLVDLTDTTHAIFGIQTAVFAKKDDAGARSLRVGMFSDATLTNGADHALPTSYASIYDIFELDPDGGVAWTPTQLNAAFIQVEVRP